MAEDKTRQIRLVRDVDYREDQTAEGHGISLRLETQDGVEHTFYLRASDLRALAFCIEELLPFVLKRQSNSMKGATRRRLKQRYHEIAEFLE